MKIIRIVIFLLVYFNTSLIANSNEDLQNILSEGGKLIFIRHAHAPGSGDPDNLDVLNCASQRNLNNVGIEQAKDIGKFFLKNHIENSTVLSSEWCRCKETAKYAFKYFKTKFFLNSFFSQELTHNRNKQMKELKRYINKWNGKGNLIFVTHYVVILEILNISTASGEIVVTDKDFTILARQKTSNN